MVKNLLTMLQYHLNEWAFADRSLLFSKVGVMMQPIPGSEDFRAGNTFFSSCGWYQ